MPVLLAFPLAEVLDLAAHAINAPSHATPVYDEPSGPALLLVALDGVYLLSNGLPQYDAAPGQAQAFGIRAVYADKLGPGTPPVQRDHALGHVGEALVPVPLPGPVITRLRKAAAEHYDIFTLTLTATNQLLGVARSRPLHSA